MSDSVTFRGPVSESAAPQAPAPEPQTPDTPGDTDVAPIALYSELKGRPYAADHFKVSDIWDMNEGMQADLIDIDGYYRDLVQKGDLQDGKDSYKQFIKQAEKVTDTKNANINLKIAKIAEYAKFMNRMQDIERERDRWQ